MIFVTSSTVVRPKAFTRTAAHALPGDVSEASFSRVWDVIWWLPVKGWHFFEFALLAWLLVKASRRPGLALALTAIYAGLDEGHQSFIPERGALLSDVAIDVAGAAVGVGVWLFFSRRANRPVR